MSSVPAIDDPNTGIKIWESGAIIEYLIAQYDTSNKLSYKDTKEKWATVQWLHFQTSGQGPYFGQAAWYIPSQWSNSHFDRIHTKSFHRFTKFHPDRIESAIERYKKEIMRVNGVLNSVLEGKQYLVGDKCTYADLAFVTWETMVPFIFGDDKRVGEMKTELPAYSAWMERMMSRPAVKKVLDDKTKAASS